VAAEPAVGSRVSFVACPVYRDADFGRKSGCWLADDVASGTRYDASLGLTKPQLGRDVLVEGVVASGPDACGGVILEPVRTSTLTSTCAAVIVPAEGFPGRRYVTPPEVLPQTWVPRTPPAAVTTEQHYSIVFELNSDFLNYQYSEVMLDEIARVVAASKARAVRLTGYAATTPYKVSGHELREPASLARDRVEMVAEALRRLDVAPSIMTVTWSSKPPAALAQPLAEASKRRVDVTIIP
jgi:outer membrane protein OmpA-like peptidoglycan-associated protein